MLCFSENVFSVIYCPVIYIVPVKELTANVDLQLTEVGHVIARKLHDDVSVPRHVGGTLQVKHTSCTGEL